MAIGVFLVAMDLTIVVSCTHRILPIFPMFKGYIIHSICLNRQRIEPITKYQLDSNSIHVDSNLSKAYYFEHCDTGSAIPSEIIHLFQFCLYGMVDKKYINLQQKAGS